MPRNLTEAEYDFQVEALTFKLHSSVDQEKLKTLSTLFNDMSHDTILATTGYFLAMVIEQSGDAPAMGKKTICALSEGVGRFTHDLAHTMRNHFDAQKKRH